MADRPGRVLEYRGSDIVVEYEPKLCVHAAECVHGLKAVFDPDRKPWLDPDAAEAAEIVQVIERCPTGALRFRPGEGVAAEAAAESNTIRVVPDGPLYLRGRLRIRTADGTETEAHRVALCRCGASEKKPYCDGRHREIGFQAE